MNVCVPSDSVENQSTRSARNSKTYFLPWQSRHLPVSYGFPTFSFSVYQKETRGLQFSATQNSCPTFFPFFTICYGQVALNLHTFQLFRYFVRHIGSGRAIKPRLHATSGFFSGIGVLSVFMHGCVFD